MQNSKALGLIDETINEFNHYFVNKIDGFTVKNYMDNPHIEFSLEFKIYNYYKIIFNYDRGRFGCAIIQGEHIGIGIESSQKWYDKADFNIFMKEIDEQIRLRIPDKYLKYYGWL